MSNFEKREIRADLRANPLLLLSIWFLLIILPFLILYYAFDEKLKESEDRLLNKAKIQIIDELNIFSNSLSSVYFINDRLNKFQFKSDDSKINAALINKGLEKHIKAPTAAVFCYSPSDNSFDGYVSPNLKEELGLYSRNMLRRFIQSYSNSETSPTDRERSLNYFQRFLLAAGGINMKLDEAVPVLSGKANLRKMVVCCKSLGTSSNEQRKIYLLCLFREQDLPLKEVISNAINSNQNKDYRWGIVRSSSQDGNTDFLYDFEYDKEGLLYGISALPETVSLRLATLDSYYPFNIEKLKKNIPYLKVTASNDVIRHPMRNTLKKLLFPAIILMIIVSAMFINLGIFGYVGRANILKRIIICISTAIAIPFASFSLSAFYNHSLFEEQIIDEMQQFTLLQTEIIKKTIGSYKNNAELKITELRESLSNLNKEEIESKLRDWLKKNDADIISFNYENNKEILIKATEEDYISPLALDAKSFTEIGFRNIYRDVDLSDITTTKQLEQKYAFHPGGLSDIVANIGKIYVFVPNEPNFLYSVFPVFADMKKEAKYLGHILIKFDTFKILKKIKETSPELFKENKMNNHVTRNSIIPITNEGTLPHPDKMLLAKNINIQDKIQKLDEVIIQKSTKTWETKESINICTYDNQMNCLIFSSTEKPLIDKNYTIYAIQGFLYYFIMLIVIFSRIMSKVIVEPIKKLIKASESLAQGDYNRRILHKSGDELEELTKAFNDMSKALLQKEKMSKYVSKEVIEEVSQGKDDKLQPGGERVMASILFCALKGKKPFEQLSSKETISVIGNLIYSVDEVASANGGQIDKLVEDTLMVVFRQTNGENVVIKACKTALEISRRLKAILPDFELNIGIASGEVVSGKIGSKNGKLDYTVIGNPVNLAARLKGLAYKAKETGIILCPQSIRILQGHSRLNYLERVTIKGRTNRTFPLYELLELRDV